MEFRSSVKALLLVDPVVVFSEEPMGLGYNFLGAKEVGWHRYIALYNRTVQEEKTVW